MTPDLFGNGYQAQLRRRAHVFGFARDRALEFRLDFIPWLEKNLHVWEAFEAEAWLHVRRGAKRWGARTIGEYLRRETAVRMKSDGEWKVNDHRWPDLARLWLLLNPECGGFFELRDSPQRREASL